MIDPADARRELRRGMFPDPTPATPETTMTDDLNALTAGYLAVTAASADAYAAKLAADAVYEAAHGRWRTAGRAYAVAVFRSTDGPAKERVVVTPQGVVICRIVGTPSGTGTTYSVDHAPVAATVPGN